MRDVKPASPHNAGIGTLSRFPRHALTEISCIVAQGLGIRSTRASSTVLLSDTACHAQLTGDNCTTGILSRWARPNLALGSAVMSVSQLQP